jgi:DNA-binding transcriptional MerR regulator
MHIGRVAKKIGLTPDAIRFYERNSLIPRPSRSAGGFRQYGDADVETLRFIRQAQHLGFSLKEIRELTALRSSRLQPCAPVCLRLETKLSQVRQAQRSANITARIANGAAHLQEGTAQEENPLPDSYRRKTEPSRGCDMKIEVLYILDCPHYPAALAELKNVLALEKISTQVSEVLVANSRMAQAMKFRGSPTIRINGRDIAGESELQHFAVSCRLYPGEKQPGIPPAEMIHRAVRDAMRGDTV